MSGNARVVLITGASSGIGLAAANAFLDAGYTVYGLSRHPFPAARHIHLTADIADEAQAHAAVETVLAREGRLDILVNSAGFGISGAIEFTTDAEARSQFDVNFFGTLHCIRAALPHMRQARAGLILNLGSVAGSIPIPFQAFYSAAKAAIASVTMALQNELRPFGVHAVALLPGDVKTGFTAARQKSAAGGEVYAALARSVAGMERDEQNGMSADVLGRRIVAIAQKRHPKALYSCGLQYQFFLLLARLLPMRTLNWLVGLLYAKA